jgi:hypothetical protein
MGIIWTLIVAFLITLLLTAMYKAVMTFMDYTHPEKKVTLKTELPFFKEAYTNDNTIDKGGKDVEQSISLQYEEMCIRNPLDYKDKNKVFEVLNKYKDIISGKVLDPTGYNIPSEYIDCMPNPDYMKYLNNQKKNLNKLGQLDTWVHKEHERFYNTLKYNELQKKFIASLIEFGIPEKLVYAAVSDYRLNAYTPNDWDKLKNTLKRYLEEFDGSFTLEYTVLFEGDRLHDYQSMEKYCTLRDSGVEADIAKIVIDGDITDEQLYTIISLIDKKAYKPYDAIMKVLTDFNKKEQEEELRSFYKRKTARR